MPDGKDKAQTHWTEKDITTHSRSDGSLYYETPDGKQYASRAALLKFETEAEKIERLGNSDAKILAKAFVEYSKNGLVQSDITAIEKLDDILKGADIVISPDGNTAAIAQNDGQTFTIHSKPPAKGR